jgi:hypothetical protein
MPPRALTEQIEQGVAIATPGGARLPAPKFGGLAARGVLSFGLMRRKWLIGAENLFFGTPKHLLIGPRG